MLLEKDGDDLEPGRSRLSLKYNRCVSMLMSVSIIKTYYGMIAKLLNLAVLNVRISSHSHLEVE